MREISSANIAFGSANIPRYYTVQQLIAQLSSAHGETQLNAAEQMVENFPWVICAIVVKYFLLHR